MGNKGSEKRKSTDKKPLFIFSLIFCCSFLVFVTIPVNASWAVTPQISAGYYHTAVIKSDGTLWAWGYNAYGAVGDGTNTQRISPVQIGTDNTWVSVAAGGYHTIALKSDGTLWAWGDNYSGQLGDGTTTYKYSPIQIGTDNNWMSISAGDSHSIALKSDGTLWAWGYNSFGQLGVGTTTAWNRPVQVGTDNRWVSVEAGNSHNIALKSDGTLWAWGWNITGQLGDGTTANKYYPFQIGTDNKWVSLAAGEKHTIALKSDGTLWAWGYNYYGQLGDGTTTTRYSPVQVGTDNRWIIAAAGSYHTIALKSDGILWAWGDNYSGQLGDGTTLDKRSPVQIGTDNNWMSISAGGFHTIALKSDGTLWAWGWNSFGQLGDGTTVDKTSPVLIAVVSIISINDGATYTNSTSVTLSLTAPNGSSVVEMQFSNDGITWSAPEPFTATKSWDLAPGEGTKIVYVKFKDSAGIWSVAYSDTIILTTAPTNLTAAAASSTQINLTWTDNSTDETGFVIERKTGATGTYAQKATVGANVTSYTDTGLTQNTTYYYRVKATNASGSSTYSNEAGATTLTLNAPSNLTVMAISSTKITLTWTDNSNDETGFAIERKTGATGTYAQVAAVGANVTTYSDTGLTLNMTYYYRVRAYNGTDYSAYVTEASATTFPVSEPSSLSASAASSARINLAWTDNAANETGFVIERKTGATGTYAQKATVGANVTSYTDTGLTQNTTYYYRVKATNASGSSAYSNEAGATTLTLNAPSNLTTSAISSTMITLTWTDNSNDETGFAIERKTGATGTYAQVAAVGTNAASYTDTGLSKNTAYYYRVRSYNETNYSAYSIESNATTYAVNEPANLTATALSSSQIKLTWTDNSTEEYGFFIERKTGEAGTYTEITASLVANSTSYTDTNLTQNTTYYYRVRAYTCCTGFAPTNYSAYSNEAGATTLTLNAPSNLTATALSSSQIKLTWTDNSTEEYGFFIERKIGEAGTYTEITASLVANSTSYTDTNLTQNTTYYYRVRAYTCCTGFNPTNYSEYAEASVRIIAISNAGISSNTLNTAANETSTIFFTIDSPATVTLKIIPESQGPAGAPVYQASQTVAAAGAYMFTWDGKNSAGSVVPDEAYLYTMEAHDGGSGGWYSPPAPTGTGSISCSQGTGYNASHNEPLAINYTPGQPSRINLSIKYTAWPAISIPLMSSVPHIAGSHAFAWDGRNSSTGKISPAGGAVGCAVASLMRENIIITSGDTPKISGVKTDPYAVNFSYGEFTKIKYSLSRGANVTVKLTSPSGTTTTLLNAQTQTAGAHEVEWTAVDAADTTGKKIVTSEQGYYTVLIQAVNPVTGTSSTARASLKAGL